MKRSRNMGRVRRSAVAVTAVTTAAIGLHPSPALGDAPLSGTFSGPCDGGYVNWGTWRNSADMTIDLDATDIYAYLNSCDHRPSAYGFHANRCDMPVSQGAEAGIKDYRDPDPPNWGAYSTMPKSETCWTMSSRLYNHYDGHHQFGSFSLTMRYK